MFDVPPTRTGPVTLYSSPATGSSSQTGRPWLVYVENSAAQSRADNLQSAERFKGAACFRGLMRLLGIGNPSKGNAELPMLAGFHGTGIKSAIGLMTSGLKERDITDAQSGNLSAGRLCIARTPGAASDYAHGRLGAKPGSLAAVMAITPKNGIIDVSEQCDSGGLERIQGNGHDAEFSVSEALYSSLDVQLHSLLCRVKDHVATFKVRNAGTPEITLVDNVRTRTIALSVVEVGGEGNGRASTVVLNLSTGQPLSWEDDKTDLAGR